MRAQGECRISACSTLHGSPGVVQLTVVLRKASGACIGEKIGASIL